MSAVGNIIRKIIPKRKSRGRGSDSSSGSLGSPIIKPSEKKSVPSGQVATESSATVPTGSVSQAISSGKGGKVSMPSKTSSGTYSSYSRTSGRVAQPTIQEGSVTEALKTITQPKLTRQDLIKKGIVPASSRKIQSNISETYSPTRGQFETYKKDIYGQGTRELVSARLPTIKEKQKIDIREKYAVTASKQKIREDVKRLENLEDKRKNLIEKYNAEAKKKIDKEGNFIGTAKEYDTLKKIEREIEISEQKIESIDKTRVSSFFKYKRDVPIKRLKTDFGQVNIIAETVSKAAGKVASKLGKEEGYFKTGGKTIEVTTPIFGTSRDYNPITGRGVSEIKQEVYIKKKAIGTPEQFRKVTEGAVSLGKYFVPVVGGAIVASEIGESISESGYSVGKYIKEKPVEAAILGGTILTGGALKVAGKITKPILKITGKSTAEVTTIGRQFFKMKPMALIKDIKLVPKATKVESTFLISKTPTKQKQVDEVVYSLFKDVKGFSREVKPGVITKITTKEGKELTRKAAQEYLEKMNIQRDVKFIRPQIRESKFTGEILQVQKSGSSKSFLRGKIETTSPVETVSGIKTGSKMTVRKDIISESIGAKPVAEIKFSKLFPEEGKIKYKLSPVKAGEKTPIAISKAKEIETFLTKEGRPFSKLRLGKQEKVSAGLSRTEKAGEKIIDSTQVDIYKSLGASEARGTIGFETSTLTTKVERSVSPATILVKGEKVKPSTPISFVKDTAKAKQGSKDFIKNIGDKLQKEQKLLAKESVELLSSISPKVSPDVKVTTKILKPTVKDTKKISGNVVSLLQTKETVEKTDLAPKKLFIETMNNKLASVKQIPIQKAISDVGIETIQKKDVSRITGKRIKSDIAQKEKVQVISDIISDLGQKQKSKQKIKQRQESRYLFNLEQLKPIKSTPKEQKAKEVPKSKSPIVKIKLDSLPKRLVKSSENGFEAFGFEFGEKKKVKTGTKEEVAIVLKKFLKGGLSASGEVIEKKTGRKLRFSELSDIFGEEFRAGKSDTGKIVEKRSKRLRKGTTGKEVQFFRRSSKKSKRTKSASIFKL